MPKSVPSCFFSCVTVDDGELEGEAAFASQAQAAEKAARVAASDAAKANEGAIHGLLDLAKEAKADWAGKIFPELERHPELAQARPKVRKFALLHHAAHAGQLGAVRRLLFDFSVPPTLPTGDGETAEAVAKSAGHTETAELLAAATRNAARLVEGWAANAIHDVLDMAKWGDWASVRKALQAQPTLAASRPRVRRFALLHHAAYWGDADMVRDLLLTYNVPPGQLTKDGKSAVDIAREQEPGGAAGSSGAAPAKPSGRGQQREQQRDAGKCDAVVRLILGVQEEKMHGLLSTARDAGKSEAGWQGILSELAAQPALATAPLPSGRKFGLLHHAAYWGVLPVVEALVKEHGLSPLQRTREGQSAAEVAAQQGHEETAKFLRAWEKGSAAGEGGEAGARLSFDELLARSKALVYFREHGVPTANRLNQLQGAERKEAEEDAAATWPLLHGRTKKLYEELIAVFQADGRPAEKAVYAGMTARKMAARMVRARPLMFMTGVDEYLLPTGECGIGWKDFDALGSDKEKAPLRMRDYLSYDEMAASSLLAVSTPCHFINRGDRANKGLPAASGSFERRGVFVAQVGARFERPGLMEWQHLVLDSWQNTRENGYGPDAAPSRQRDLLRTWARFYGLKYFPTYDEGLGADALTAVPGYDTTATLKTPRFVKVDKYGSCLDLELYYRRMRNLAEVFLLEAQARAVERGKKAFCHVVGLGIGVWSLAQKEQAAAIEQAYLDAIASLALPDVSDLCFAWFPTLKEEWLHFPEQFPGNNVRLGLEKRDPAEKLTGEHAGKLLVAQYAWDSNSFPGNEYWMGLLSASGDPAAACCSTIPELQNPQVNTVFPERLRLREPPV